MTGINLYQEKQADEKKMSSRAANGGFFFSLAILAITLLALAGLKFAVKAVNSKNEAVLITIQDENTKLTGESDLDKVSDLQARLGFIKENLQINNGSIEKIGMDYILDKLSKELNSEIVVSEYKYQDKKIDLAYTALNFDDAAKQLLVFKNSKYFSNVTLNDISRGEKFIVCKISMNIK